MKLAAISPPEDRVDEIATLGALFSAGLERYHLRKPAWQRDAVEAWLASLPPQYRTQVFVHGHPDLALRFRLGGAHFPDAGGVDPAHTSSAVSRSCHDPSTLKARLGRCDAVLFGPVFASVSKLGYGPLPARLLDEVRGILHGRSEAERSTRVFAIGGITADRLGLCQALGFDGAAVLGAVWAAADPVGAFTNLLRANRAPTNIPPSLGAQP